MKALRTCIEKQTPEIPEIKLTSQYLQNSHQRPSHWKNFANSTNHCCLHNSNPIQNHCTSQLQIKIKPQYPKTNFLVWGEFVTSRTRLLRQRLPTCYKTLDKLLRPEVTHSILFGLSSFLAASHHERKHQCYLLDHIQGSQRCIKLSALPMNRSFLREENSFLL